MNTFPKIWLIVGFIVLLLVVGACSQAEGNDQPETFVPPSRDYVTSLKENLPEFESLAQEWHADAYLLDVSLPIGFRDDKPYVYAVGYASTSDRLTIGFMKLPDGTITTDYFPGAGESPNEAIQESDWELDSLEIFDLAYGYLNPEYALDESGHICGIMVLRRYPNLPGEPVIWRVYFESCTSPTTSPSGNIIIDPLSGIEIRRELSPLLGGSQEFLTPVP